MKPLLLLFAVSALVALSGGSAVAHGHRDVGDLDWTVGWAVEPALVGQPNAVDLAITRGATPLEGAEKGLKVEVSIGDETSDALDLTPVFDTPGEYRADIIPTVPGDYTFHFTGELEGEKVDETFTASKDDFSLIEGTGDLAFPKKAPTNTELAERLENVERTANDATDSIAMPRIAGIVGVVLGLIAIALAVRTRRSSS
jgi:hypothetical protein